MSSEAFLAKLKIAHGVLASTAWVVTGAMAVRLLPVPVAVHVHRTSQLIGSLIFVAAAGMGIHLVIEYNNEEPGFNMKAHPVIGSIIFGLTAFQVILGIVHHALFKKRSRRSFWTDAHIWLGRILITLAMINGGLGLQLAYPYQANTKTGEIVYGVFAGLMWTSYMCVSVYSEIIKRKIEDPSAPPGRQPRQLSTSTATSTAVDADLGEQKDQDV